MHVFLSKSLRAAAALVLGATGSAHAAEFDVRGVLQLPTDAVLAQSFDVPDDLAAAGVVLLDPNFSPLGSTAADLSAYVALEGVPLEGASYLRIPRSGFRDDGPQHVRIPLPPVAGSVEIRVWTRAAGAVVTLWAMYGMDPDAVSFAAVAGVPTGRRTSDDWVELTTGPLEPDVLGRPLNHVLLSGGSSDLWVDALEVRPLGARRVPKNAACTFLDTQNACGTYGECVLGQCVDAAAVWGAVPYTAGHRKEYVDRVKFIFERMHANRESVTNRGAAMSARLDGLVMTDSPRLFHGGVGGAVNFFKDGHTSGPSPFAKFYSSVPSSLQRQSSGALGICLGLTQLDLQGGANGYTVFRTGGDGVASELRVGDILFKVDRLGLRGWMERAYELANLGSDRESDAAFWATELPALLSMRASVLEFVRCESTTSCQNPTVISIPVAERLRTRLGTSGHLLMDVQPMACDGRFSNAVQALAPPDPDGNDVVSWETEGGITSLQTDGVAADEGWDNAIAAALTGNPDKLLFDTRLGNGGYLQRVAYVVGRLRDSTNPISGFGIQRPWDQMDPPGLYDGLRSCIDDDGMVFFGKCSATIGFETSSAPASAINAKVAWLHTQDISGNDYAPRLLTGRPNLRIFGPVPTAGAFGAIVSLPPLLPGEYAGGSIQVHDTRFAASRDALLTAPYASGTGVRPDEVVLQKLSDSLVGRDTMLNRARAWLMEAP